LKKFFKSRKGIAPAIAVALLLAVTIALVAAIGYSATLVTPSADAAPQGVFDVEIFAMGPGMGGFVRMRQYSGDAIDTGDMKLVFTAKGNRTEVLPNTNNTFYNSYFYPQTWTNGTTGTATIGVAVNGLAASGVTVTTDIGTVTETTNTFTDGSGVVYLNYTVAAAAGTWINVTSADGIDAIFTTTGLANGEIFVVRMYEYNSPWHSIPSQLPADYPEIRFGEYTVTPGNTLKALDVAGPWGYYPELGGVDDVHAVLSNWDSIEPGDVVEVMMIYTPTDQVIWQGDVIVG
jgi:FlaG/FlaF family flagellin (archaellin)